MRVKMNKYFFKWIHAYLLPIAEMHNDRICGKALLFLNTGVPHST